MEKYLKATLFLDFEDLAFQDYIKPFISYAEPIDRAIAFYNFVRDGFLYDPYHLDLRPEHLKASHIITKNRAWCVEKAIVFAAGLRALGIPARLGYAIVENHIGLEKMERVLRTSKIVFHGYVDVFLNNVWTKATPAFDQRVCAINGVEPLIWNAIEDSLFQEFVQGQKYMQYHHDYGVFEDVPHVLMHDEMQKHYPHLFRCEIPNTKRFSFHFENKWRLS
jgi:hypothetical protein